MCLVSTVLHTQGNPLFYSWYSLFLLLTVFDLHTTELTKHGSKAVIASQLILKWQYHFKTGLEALGKLQHLVQTQVHSHTQDLNPWEKNGWNKSVWCETLDRDTSVLHAAWQTQQWLSFSLFLGQIWETKAINASAPHVCPMWLLEDPLHISCNAVTHVHAHACVWHRTWACCDSQMAHSLEYRGGFSNKFFETYHPVGANVALQPCPAACGIVPATTDLCLFSHFLLPFHSAWYWSLSTSKQRHHKR